MEDHTDKGRAGQRAQAKTFGFRKALHTLLAALALASLPARAGELTLQNVVVQVYFSPNGGAENAVVGAIDQARESIRVQAYSFTSAPIAGALKKAHDRGVQVVVILDTSQRSEHYTVATFLQHAGIPVFIDSAHAIAHSKVMILDDATVITGSFNFTKAAEQHNSENLLVIHDRGLAKVYGATWELHQGHSARY